MFIQAPLSQLLHQDGSDKIISAVDHHINQRRLDIFLRSIWLNRAINYPSSTKLMERKHSHFDTQKILLTTWMAQKSLSLMLRKVQH